MISIPRNKSINLVRPLYCTIPYFTGRIGASQVLTNPSVRSQGRRALEAKGSFSILLEQINHLLWHRAKLMRTQNECVLEKVENVFIQIFLSKRMELAANFDCMLINSVSNKISKGPREGRTFGTSFWGRHLRNSNKKQRRIGRNEIERTEDFKRDGS
ncbi:hypothetical protein L3X38_028208 [Prunus dulcis]|uniref:Uncharacterized protein n=1 Tax=Prunus dulcis TaxID=3755 RepID=A0AAD4VQ87_PRUDU|nr:hypothetical protein L3X38_028208 [Prunus dulcis]